MKNSLLRGIAIFGLGASLLALSACAEQNDVEEPTEPVQEDVLTEEPMMEEPMMADSMMADSTMMEEPMMEEGAGE